MKIDLDELERKVVNTEGNRCGCAVTLALIARVRELEVAVNTAADDLGGLRITHRAELLLDRWADDGGREP